MKKFMALGLFLSICLILSACSSGRLKSGRNEEDASNSEVTDVDTKESESAAATPKASDAPEEEREGSQPTNEVPARVTVDSNVFAKSIEDTDSYTRKIKYTTLYEGEAFDKLEEYAYLKSPLASHTILDFTSSGSYDEEIFIDNTVFTRMTKTDKWDKYVQGEWYKEKPVTYSYLRNVAPYPIEYEKLTFTPVAREEVNGVSCVKCTLSGSYESDITFNGSDEEYPIKLSASGDIWIADDPDVGPAMIRQRIKVNADIEYKQMLDDQGNPTHAIMEDLIEDDILDINATIIGMPSDQEINVRPSGDE